MRSSVLFLLLLLLSGSAADVTVTSATNRLALRPAWTLISEAIDNEVFLWCLLLVEDATLLQEVRWIAPDGRTIKNETGKLLIDEDIFGFGLGLLIYHLRESDGGIYRCAANYKGIALPEVTVEIQPFRSLTWEAQQSQSLVDDSRGLIRCRVTADPEPTVTWFKDDAPYEPDNSRCTLVADGISCDPVTLDDAGKYVCTASRADTQVPSSRVGGRVIWVRVNVLPVIENFVDYLKVTEGDSVRLNCSAAGSGLTYKWFRRNVLVKNRDGFRFDKTDGSLRITQVSSDDSGNFTCIARNKLGDSNPADVYLAVMRNSVESGKTNFMKAFDSGNAVTRRTTDER